MPPLRPQLALPTPPFSVAYLFNGSVQAAVVIAAVPAHDGVAVGYVRKLIGTNQIAPAQLQRIDAQRVRHRIHRTFDDVGAFGPARAAVGIDRRRVRRYQPHFGVKRRDVVGTGCIGRGVDSRYAGPHIREVWAEVSNRTQLDPQHLAIVLDGRFNILDMRAAMRRSLVALTAGFSPSHRAAEMTRRISAKDLFRIEVHLAAEAAANVRRDQMQAMFRPAQRFGEPAL